MVLFLLGCNRGCSPGSPGRTSATDHSLTYIAREPAASDMGDDDQLIGEERPARPRLQAASDVVLHQMCVRKHWPTWFCQPLR
jgi:hypothetical protein